MRVRADRHDSLTIRLSVQRRRSVGSDAPPIDAVAVLVTTIATGGGSTPGRDARAAESARLESVCGATHRGFESHSLRSLNKSMPRGDVFGSTCSRST